MSYEYITKYDSPNFGYGVSGTHGQNDPKRIVVHHWGIDGQHFDNVVRYLCRANGNTSAHYVLEANKIACIVNPKDAAYHCGDAYWNQHSIGIECRPEMTDGDIETLCELIAELWHAFGKLEVVGHRDIVATSCPGRYYSKLSYIRQRAEQIYSGSKQPKPQAKPKPTPKPKPSVKPKKSVSVVAQEVINGKWGNGDARISKLKKAGYDPKEVQAKVNEILTGKPSPKPKPKPQPKFKVGDWVGVKNGAKTYDGKSCDGVVKGKVYYTLDELKGNRAVLDIDGICTPFNVKDLFK